MNKERIIKKLNEETKYKNGNFKKNYKEAIYKILSGDKEFRDLKFWAGPNRHLRLSDTLYCNICTILDILDVKYQELNKAPRGGVEGDYIKLKRKISKSKLDLLRSIM